MFCDTELKAISTRVSFEPPSWFGRWQAGQTTNNPRPGGRSILCICVLREPVLAESSNGAMYSGNRGRGNQWSAWIFLGFGFGNENARRQKGRLPSIRARGTWVRRAFPMKCSPHLRASRSCSISFRDVKCHEDPKAVRMLANSDSDDCAVTHSRRSNSPRTTRVSRSSASLRN